MEIVVSITLNLWQSVVDEIETLLIMILKVMIAVRLLFLSRLYFEGSELLPFLFLIYVGFEVI